jgi:hypothetical protein
MTDQEWQFRDFAAPNGEQDTATFLNEPLRHPLCHGEASATVRNNGTAGLFFLEPGSLGNDTSPSWVVREFRARAARRQAGRQVELGRADMMGLMSLGGTSG